MSKTQLYGGAITVDLPLEDLMDASQIRQIPDTQEVYVAKNGAVSIIFDLLESIAADDASQRVLCHLQEINSINGVEQQTGVIPKLISGPYGDYGIVHVKEKVLKFGKDLHDINIYIGVIHLQQSKTDIVVTLNVEDNEADISEFEGMVQSLKVEDWGLFG